jgi:hypothetical protein
VRGWTKKAQSKENTMLLHLLLLDMLLLFLCGAALLGLVFFIFLFASFIAPPSSRQVKGAHRKSQRTEKIRGRRGQRPLIRTCQQF